MTRRPPPPDAPVRGKTVALVPSLRPKGPIEASDIVERLPYREALNRLAALYPDRRAANAALVRLIMSDQLPVTCRELRYDGAAGQGPAAIQWPGQSANLAKQMARAHGSPFPIFSLDDVMGDARWTDLIGTPVVKAYAAGLHVDGEALAMLLALPVAECAPPTYAEPVAVPLEAPKPREQTLKQFVLACVESGIASWTVAYSKHYKPAVSEGQVAQKSRAQFEAAYKEHYPNPKSGPKSGE